LNTHSPQFVQHRSPVAGTVVIVVAQHGHHPAAAPQLTQVIGEASHGSMAMGDEIPGEGNEVGLKIIDLGNGGPQQRHGQPLPVAVKVRKLGNPAAF
jgi:hypothetical protein